MYTLHARQQPSPIQNGEEKKNFAYYNVAAQGVQEIKVRR